MTVQAVVPGARLGGSGEKSLRSCDFVNDCSKRIRAGCINELTWERSEKGPKKHTNGELFLAPGVSMVKRLEGNGRNC